MIQQHIVQKSGYMPNKNLSNNTPQYECNSCRKNEKNAIQRSAIQDGPETVPPIVYEVLQSPGQPLDAKTRAFMEPRLGHDFSRVRVHCDSKAAESARAVGAQAYTVGRDIVFGAGHYAPKTTTGRHLISHEIAHVIQQDADYTYSSTSALHVDPSSVAEQEATLNARRAMEANVNVSNHPARGLRRLAVSLQRSTGNDRCSGADARCTSGDKCILPDPGWGDVHGNSTSWTFLVNIDVEHSSWETALRKQEFGHTYVKFIENNGRRYTYGFYPGPTRPNETRPTVPGCVHHPDTTHDRCIDDTMMYSLNERQYNAALAFAQSICRTGHTYGVNYTCTTFADDIVRAAGQSLPSSRSAPTEIFFQKVPAIDNPNTLFENVQEERRRAPNQRFPYWNSPCMNRCESEFNECLRTNRMGGMICFPRREHCMRKCPKP